MQRKYDHSCPQVSPRVVWLLDKVDSPSITFVMSWLTDASVFSHEDDNRGTFRKISTSVRAYLGLVDRCLVFEPWCMDKGKKDQAVKT